VTKPSRCATVTFVTSCFTFRRTQLGADDFQWLQGLIDSGACLSNVARAACERYDWRRPNGKIPLAASSVMLRHLEQRGVLRLPPPTQRRRVSPERERVRILDELGVVGGDVNCQPEGPLTVRPITREERDGFRLHLQRFHYLGFERSVGESMGYAALMGDELVALLDWGSAVPRCASRDCFIGWDRASRDAQLPLLVANRRFLVLPWVRLKCLASQVLAANLRRLNRDWQAVYGHSVLLAETFVDTSRHRGTCYRASNWTYVGRTRGFTRLKVGFAPNHRPKAVFVYELVRHGIERLRRGRGALR
jgi:hypothetical protein